MRGRLSALPLTLQVASRLSDAATRQNSVLLDLKRPPESKKTCIAASPVNLVPIIGFELMTYRLQGGCSTN